MQIIFRHPRCTMDHLGLIPDMLRDDDPTPLTQQLHEGYPHGGGWHPFKGFTLQVNDSLAYPGDPPLRPVAEFRVAGHEDRVLMYEHAWVAVIRPDRSFEVCRMD